MFCAFSGSPKIVRLYGKGRTVEPADPDFEGLRAHFGDAQLPRAVIVVDVHRVADSCGYGVPKMALQGPRDQLAKWTEKKGPEGVMEYRRVKNSASIDGLPGLVD